MEIFVRCDACQKSLAVDSANEGKKARCPVCGHIFVIRAGQDTSQAPPGFNAPQFQSGPAPYAPQPQRPGGNVQNDAYGWVSVSLGIVAVVASFVTCCCPFTGLISVGAGIAGIVTGIFALDQTLKIVGLITNGIGLALGAGLTVLRFVPFFFN